MAGVSPGTVDRVIHQRKEVSPATRTRILKILKKTGYTPNLIAKSLASKKKYRIAALLPSASNDNPYWVLPLKGVEKAIAEINDFNGNVDKRFFDLNNEASFIRTSNDLIKDPPDGILFPPVFPKSSLKLIQQIESKQIPYVFIDSSLDNRNSLSYIGQDAMQSGFLAAKLICYGLRNGETILVINLARPEGIMHHLQKRQKGFISYFDTCRNNKKVQIDSLEIDLTQTGEPEQHLDEYFIRNREVRAIFVTSSKVHKIARYLKAHGKAKILLVGYDLIEENKVYLNDGTIDFLISQQPETQGYLGIMTLFRHLNRQEIPGPVQYSPIDIITAENIKYYLYK